MKKSSDTHEALAHDLTEVFFKLLRQYPEKKTYEIMEMVPLQKAPRFYVSFETARRHLSRKKRRLKFYKIQLNKINLYNELYKRWKLVNNGEDFKNNRFEKLHSIIHSEAPCFYISKDAARSIIYKYLRKK